MGKKTSVKLTHSTVYIPWVGKKRAFSGMIFPFASLYLLQKELVCT